MSNLTVNNAQPWREIFDTVFKGKNSTIHAILIVMFGLFEVFGVPQDLLTSAIYALVPVVGGIIEIGKGERKATWSWNLTAYAVAIVAIFAPSVATYLSQGIDVIVPIIESIKNGNTSNLIGQLSVLLSFVWGIIQQQKEKEAAAAVQISGRSVPQDMEAFAGIPAHLLADIAKTDTDHGALDVLIDKVKEGRKILLYYRVKGRLMYSYQVKNSPAPQSVQFFCAPVGDLGDGRTVMIEFVKNHVYEKSNIERAIDQAVADEQKASGKLKVEGMRGPVAGGVWFGTPQAELLRWELEK